jgi:hypothetical protein
MRKTTVYVRKSDDNIRKSESSTNRWRMRTLVELGRIVKDDTRAKFQRNSYAFSVTDFVDSAIPTHFCRKNRRPTKMKRLGFGTLFHPNFSIARRVEGIDELINRGNQAETRLEKICAVADLFRRTRFRLLESAL